MDISDVLPLPSSSSSNHCQKQVTAITPTAPRTLRFCQFCWSNYKIQGIDWQVWQFRAKPNQERPETTLHEPARVGWSFCLTSTRSTRRQSFTHASRASTHPTCLLHIVSYYVSPRVMSYCHVNNPSRWPLTLTKVNIFQQGLSCSVFRVAFDFGLCFFIWGL